MKRLLAILLLLLPATAYSATATRYLAFQIFTGGPANAIPPMRGELLQTVQGLREKIGTSGGVTPKRFLYSRSKSLLYEYPTM